ncbi:MAG TPA: ABC transporter permease [Thermoanaerobaculia bacterium]|jgi:ABC-2 type transport system permease protein
MRTILFLARAEVLHIIRDRTTMLQVLLVPIAQLLILVNAATFVIRDTPMVVLDHDHTSSSRALITRFAASGNFEITRALTAKAAYEQLLDGTATLVLVIPDDFEKSLVRERRAPVHVLVNAEKGSAAGIVQSYAQRIFASHARSLGAELLPDFQSAGNTPRRGAARLDVRTRGWYNQSLNYKHYMVPGVIVALITLISTLLAAQNIAREKELGTLEQLNVTPITRFQFIAAKLLPLWILGMTNLSVGLIVGKLVFAIPTRGSVPLLFAAAALYLIVALAIGLLVSTTVETQQQAMFVTFFIMSAYLLLSGLFTPIDSMAPWVRIASLLNPVRHFVTIARAILVKAAGVEEIAQPLMFLTGFAIVTVGLAVMRYRKTSA